MLSLSTRSPMIMLKPTARFFRLLRDGFLRGRMAMVGQIEISFTPFTTILSEGDLLPLLVHIAFNRQIIFVHSCSLLLGFNFSPIFMRWRTTIIFHFDRHTNFIILVCLAAFVLAVDVNVRFRDRRLAIEMLYWCGILLPFCVVLPLI